MKPFLPGAAAASGTLNMSMHLVLLTLALVASVFFLYREMRRSECDILEAIAVLGERRALPPAPPALQSRQQPFVFGSAVPMPLPMLAPLAPLAPEPAPLLQEEPPLAPPAPITPTPSPTDEPIAEAGDAEADGGAHETASVASTGTGTGTGGATGSAGAKRRKGGK